jgi:hypothetical protein
MQYIKKNENSTDKIKIRRMRQRQHAARASEVLAEGPEGKGHSAHCKKRQSGVGISQPCAVPNAEAADMAIQSPGATWRHYNQEGRERVMRKAVLARCEAKHTPQQPNIADKRDRLYTTIPLVSHKDLTALSFASISTSRRLSNHEDLNLRMPPPGGPSMHRAGLLCECYVT